MDIRVLALPEIVSMILTWIAVLILYLVLRKKLYIPVMEFLETRKAKVQFEIDQSKIIKDEAMNLKDEYEEKIKKAKIEGQEIIENSRRRGTEIREDILGEARQEAQDIVERAKRDIAREKAKAYEDIKESTGEMAVLIASKIMEENITMDSQKQLIDKFIDEVGTSKWQN
jgi:F-type H+-transporting ATPase subunit b